MEGFEGLIKNENWGKLFHSLAYPEFIHSCPIFSSMNSFPKLAQEETGDGSATLFISLLPYFPFWLSSPVSLARTFKGQTLLSLPHQPLWLLFFIQLFQALIFIEETFPFSLLVSGMKIFFSSSRNFRIWHSNAKALQLSLWTFTHFIQLSSRVSHKFYLFAVSFWLSFITFRPSLLIHHDFFSRLSLENVKDDFHTSTVSRVSESALSRSDFSFSILPLDRRGKFSFNKASFRCFCAIKSSACLCWWFSLL